MDITRLVRAVQSATAADAFKPQLTTAQWHACAPLLGRRELQAGESLIRQGDIDRCAYLLESGNLQAFVSGGVPGGQRIAILRPGALVGEPGLFAPVPRTANVEAMTPCVAWGFGPAQLDTLVQQSPALAVAWLRAAGAVMALRLRANRERGLPL